jgi:hypothetical protein
MLGSTRLDCPGRPAYRSEHSRHIPPQGSAKRSQPKVFGRRLLRHADARESAKQAVQRIGICLTLFGQEANATQLVSKRIGNAETCSRAKHEAAGMPFQRSPYSS